MGLFFNKPYKEKVANKLYECLFEKENLIYNFKINNEDEYDFTIIIASSGIYLFDIIPNEGELISYVKKEDEFIKIDDRYKGVIEIENPYKKLAKLEEFLRINLSKFNNLELYSYPIFDRFKKVKEYEEIFTIKIMKRILKNTVQIYNNEVVDEITSKIKELNKYESTQNA